MCLRIYICKMELAIKNIYPWVVGMIRLTHPSMELEW